MSPYVAPTDSNTARLLVRAKAVPGTAYGVYAFDDPHACTKPLLIGRGNSATSPAPSALRAGPLATLQYFAVDQGRRACRIAVSFYPVRRHTYVLAASQDAGGCAVRVVDATDAENPRGVQMFRRTLQGNGCAPLTNLTRPSNESTESFSAERGARPSATTRGLEDLKGLLPEN
jgi:hypothetical protein